MLRLAGERQTLTGAAEESPNLGRTADPMLSIIELLRSRTVAGVVVDSLGLQLVSLTPEFSVEDLSARPGGSRARPATRVQLVFRDDGVSARRGERAVTAPYGQLVNLGVVQFVVRSRPAVENVTLGIRSREAAIDALVVGLLVTRREMTDVIDVAFVAEDPRSAQRIVNSTVHAFQTLNVQWARERSKRRAEFLEEQLAQTDSMLEQAQAALSAFRSRQQLASSRDKLEAAAGVAADARQRSARSSRPTCSTFGALQERLKAHRRGVPDGGAAGPGHVAGHGRQPGDRRAVQQLLKYQQRIDSMTTGPWKASATNPGPGPGQGAGRSTQEQLVQAVSSHVGALGRPGRRARAACAGQTGASMSDPAGAWRRRRCGSPAGWKRSPT